MVGIKKLGGQRNNTTRRHVMFISEKAQNLIQEQIFLKRVEHPGHNFFIRMFRKENGGLQTYFDYEEKPNDFVFDFNKFVIRVEDTMSDYFKNISVDVENLPDGRSNFLVTGLENSESNSQCNCNCNGVCNEQ